MKTRASTTRHRDKERWKKRSAFVLKARKSRKKADQKPPEKKIDNCADILNNVYHVHAPAPVNKADRSVEALKAFRKAGNKSKSTKKK